MAFHRPGTYVDEVLLQQNTPQNTTVAVAAFVGAAKRGPLRPTKCQSWADVTRNFGTFTGNAADDTLLQALYDSLQTGTRTLYAVRAAGSGAAAASYPFLTDGGAGSGVPALTVSASNPGTWGNQLYVEVVAGSTPDRFSLIVREVPLGAAITNQQIVERFTDLSLNPVDPRYVVSVINGSTLGGSDYITVEIDSDYVYDSDDPVLATSASAGGDKLTGGADGGSVTPTVLRDAVYLLDEVYQPFVLNLPGVYDATTITHLADYADASRTRSDGEPGRGDVFVVVDTQPGVDSDTAITRASTYPDSDVLAVYYPPIVVSDPSSSNPGATKLVPVGPSVVGRYIDTDAAKGVFKAPAGTSDGFLRNALSLDPAATLRNPQLDALNDANVNAIKLIPGRGICIFGARTLKKDYITRYVNARRTLIQVRADLIEATSFAPFENNDAFLWADMFNAADKVLRELHTAGGLKGSAPEQAYFVRCDATINTETTIELGEVHLEVGVALQRPAEFVVLRIGQFQGGATVTESTDAV